MRRAPREVRVGKAGPTEERRVHLGALVEEGNCPIGDPAVDVEVSGQGAFPTAPCAGVGAASVLSFQEGFCRWIDVSKPGHVVAAGAGTVSVGEVDRLEAIVGKRQFGDLAGQPHCVRFGEILGADLVYGVSLREIAWLEMDFARGVRAISGAGEDARDRRHARARPAAVLEDAMPARVHSRHEAVARRHADGVWRVCALEQHAVTRKRVNVRRAQIGMSHAAELIALLLVGIENEEVGSIGHDCAPERHQARSRGRVAGRHLTGAIAARQDEGESRRWHLSPAVAAASG